MSYNKEEDVILYRLTSKEKEKLKKDLGTTLRKIEKINHKQLDDQEQMNVRIAANSNDKDLFDLACLVAFRLLYNRNTRESNKYSHSGTMDTDDYLSETYIVIAENIKNYDGIHSLFTFFNILITKRFVELRNEGDSIPSSRRYEIMNINIKKAEREIGRKTGNYNPTPSDISEYLKIFHGKNYGEQAIIRCKELKNPSTSFENVEEIMKSYDEFGNPERVAIIKEKTEQFEEALNGLDKLSKLLILKEIEYMDTYIELPSANDLYNMMKEDKDPDIQNIVNDNSLKQIDAYLKTAHRKIKSSYSKKRRITNPVNNFKLTQEQKEALEKNAEAIDRYFDRMKK